MTTESILDRVTEQGAEADLGPAAAAPARTDAAEVVRLLRAAADALAAGEEAKAIALWTDAGRLHDLETLDHVIPEISGRGFFAFAKAGARKKLLRAARAALRQVTEVGAATLAAAIVGEIGGAEDARSLETLGRHPALTLHAATALANLDAMEGRMALLRLLHATSGEARVHVIDRLLAHARQPAVRTALLRDALPGLDGPSAREVAPDIAAACDAKGIAEDPKCAEDLRAAARQVLRAAAM